MAHTTPSGSNGFVLILDVEATCCDHGTVRSDEMEVIEIGAVMLEESTLESVSEFETFVKPIRHPILTPFCTELTGIRQSDVDRAVEFPQVAIRLQQWLSSYPNFEFYSWGDYDRKQIQMDCQLHNIANPIKAKHHNLKVQFSNYLRTSKKYGVDDALAKIGIELDGNYHRGLDDAKNIAKIFSYMHTHRSI